MAQAAHPGGAERPAPWILGSSRDLLLFVATPLLIVPVVALAQQGVSVELIGLYVGAFGALGHHLPGLMRAYGDRELFARFRHRFVFAPLFFLGVGLFFAHRDLNGLVVMTLLWGIWHGLAQVYGFCRIYDAKVGASSQWTALLDRWMCILWFGAGVLFSPDRVAYIVEEFYTSGGPVLPTAGFQSLQTAWAAATGVVTVAFLANFFWQRAQGRPPSSVKMLLIGSSLGFWWYATAGIDNAILGVAIFEIFHDVQYLAITWVYSRRSVDKGRRVGRFTRFLFRPRLALVGLYVGLVFAYGFWGVFPKSVELEGLGLTLIGLIAASTFLHFYYDSFIWKVREKATRDGLDVAGGVAGARLGAGARTGQILRWSLFVVPVALFGAAQLAGLEGSGIDRYRSLAELAPNHPGVRVALGNLLSAEGRYDEALVAYHRAAALSPEASTYEHLGDAYRAKGDPDAAVREYERALEIRPDHAQTHNNLGVLYHNEDDLDRAEVHYERALSVDPDLVETHNNLGVLLEERGELARAAAHFEAAARLDSNPTVLENLNRVRSKLAARS